MKNVFDDVARNFIDKELLEISSQKDIVCDEKKKVRIRINEIKCGVQRSDDNDKEIIFLENYESLLSGQFNLLCKRDIAIFSFIADNSNHITDEEIKKLVKPGYRLIYNNISVNNDECDTVRTISKVKKKSVITCDGREIDFLSIKKEYLILPPCTIKCE